MIKRVIWLSVALWCCSVVLSGQSMPKVPLVTYHRFNNTEVRGDEVVRYVGNDQKTYTKMNDANTVEGSYTMCIKDGIYAIAPTAYAFEGDGTIFYVQGPGSYYSDTAVGDMHYVWENAGEYFDIHTQRDSISWEITSETKEIAGLACRKALGTMRGGAVATVWYCEDIPVPYGPNRIWGTPGLVVTLQLGAFNYVLTQMEYSDKIAEIRYVPRGKSVTKEEYDRYVRERDSKYASPVQEGTTTKQIIYRK